jgi:hypothetical protein
MRRLHLVDVDLRWGITEAAATRERGVVSKCLQAIDASWSLFVCLLGQRRGRVVAPSDVSLETLEAFPEVRDQLGTTTVTEIEITHGLPAGMLAYLRDRGALDGLPGELRAMYTNAWLNNPAREAAHAQTRERVRRGAAGARDYACRWDAARSTPELALPTKSPFADSGIWRQQWAAAGVPVDGTAVPPELLPRAEAHNARLTAGRLAGFMAEGRPLADVLLEDLQAAILALHGDRAEPSLSGDEDDQQEQFLVRVSEATVERTETYAALDAYVESDETGLFALTAPSGIGKTIVLANWLDRHSSRPIARFIGASEGSTDVDTLLASIAGAAPRLRDKWTERVQGTVVLDALDALDQLDSGLADLDWLPWTLPAGLKVIVSYASDTPAGAQLRERMTAGDPIVHDLSPLNDPHQRRQLVQRYLAEYLKELGDDLLEELIASRPASNPLYLKVVLSELRVFGTYAGVAGRLRERFGDDPQSAFSELLLRLETDPAYTAVPSERVVPLFFGLLARARTGLAVEEAATIIAPRLSVDPQDVQDAIHVCLRQVRAFISRRLGRQDFLHSSFRAAAAERYADEDWHGLLGDYFDTLPPDHRRRLSELPYHLTAAGHDERARDVLCDIRFIEAKCAAGMTPALIADVERAAPLEPLPEFARFVRLEAHNLTRFASTPGFAAQQPSTRPWPGPFTMPAGKRWARAGCGSSIRLGSSAGRARRRSKGSTREPPTRPSPAAATCWRLVATARCGCGTATAGGGWRRSCASTTGSLGSCASARGTSTNRRADADSLMTGRLLSVGRFGLMVHDPLSGECLQAFSGALTVWDCAVGRGNLVALACAFATVCLYDLEAREIVERLYLERDEGLAWTCAFSPNGALLLAGGGKFQYSDDVGPFGQCSVWRTDTWELAHDLELDAMVFACCFYRNEAYAIGLLDGTVHVHDIDGARLGGFGAHSSTVRSLRAADGRLLSASLDGRVRIWSADALLGPPPYAITGPDGREMSDRWDEALLLGQRVREIWQRVDARSTAARGRDGVA